MEYIIVDPLDKGGGLISAIAYAKKKGIQVIYDRDIWVVDDSEDTTFHLFGLHLVRKAKKYIHKTIVHVNSMSIFSPTGLLLYDDKDPLFRPWTMGESFMLINKHREIGIYKSRWWIRNNPIAWMILHVRYGRVYDIMKRAKGYTVPTKYMKRIVKEAFPDAKIKVIDTRLFE